MMSMKDEPNKAPAFDRPARLYTAVTVTGTLLVIGGVNGIFSGADMRSAILTLVVGIAVLAFGSMRLFQHWRMQHHAETEAHIDLTEEKE